MHLGNSRADSAMVTAHRCIKQLALLSPFPTQSTARKTIYIPRDYYSIGTVEEEVQDKMKEQTLSITCA